MSENPYTTFGEIRLSRRLIADKLKDKDFDSVLEVGAQWGENLVWIRDKIATKALRLVGVDTDIDTTNEANKITGLDLQIGNVLNLEFDNKEFDVVCTNALFCMLEPSQVEQGLIEVMRVAKKYVILVELETKEDVGFVFGGRTGANWEKLFSKYGLKVTKEKILPEIWNATPWIDFGYTYVVELGEKRFCDQCDSKGKRHKLGCPKR